jgi:hypothetical protein
MQILLLIVQGLLGLVYTFTGGAKLVGAEQMKDDFDRFGYSDGFRLFTGLMEVSAAGLILVGFAWPAYAAWGALLVLCVMAGAIWTHLRAGDALTQTIPPLVLAGLAGWVVLAHWPL